MKRMFAEFCRWRNEGVKKAREYYKLPFYKKWFAEKPEMCACISSEYKPSWASQVHDIQYHVCNVHAKKYNIHSGPYWEKDIIKMAKESGCWEGRVVL